jgi:hypothetical protein
MAEESNPNPKPAKPSAAKKEKPPALEDKPFSEFIEQHFTPALKTALAAKGLKDVSLTFKKDNLAIDSNRVSQSCWQVSASWQQGQRQFNLYFLDEDINGNKAFSCTTNGKPPSIIESFMIDERKITLDLMVLYTLQRLNGQKWLIGN